MLLACLTLILMTGCTAPPTDGCAWTRLITVRYDKDPVLSRHLKEQIAAHNIEWWKNCR